MKSGATISKDKKYRYSLHRIWDDSLSTVMFICLNPSTADATNDDPTLRRCMGYARDWGYGGIYMANIFAFRATDPKRLKTVRNPIGPDNNRWLRKLSKKSKLVVAGWGAHGNLFDRDKEVLKLIKNINYIALTKHGIPRHPLYLRKNLKPKNFRG